MKRESLCFFIVRTASQIVDHHQTSIVSCIFGGGSIWKQVIIDVSENATSQRDATLLNGVNLFELLITVGPYQLDF